MDIGLAELLLVLALGGSTSIGSSLGGTSIAHSQPLVWMVTSIAQKNTAGTALWWALLAPRTGTLGGPVAIVKQVAPKQPAVPPPGR